MKKRGMKSITCLRGSLFVATMLIVVVSLAGCADIGAVIGGIGKVIEGIVGFAKQSLATAKQVIDPIKNAISTGKEAVTTVKQIAGNASNPTPAPTQVAGTSRPSRDRSAPGTPASGQISGRPAPTTTTTQSAVTGGGTAGSPANNSGNNAGKASAETERQLAITTQAIEARIKQLTEVEKKVFDPAVKSIVKKVLENLEKTKRVTADAMRNPQEAWVAMNTIEKAQAVVATDLGEVDRYITGMQSWLNKVSPGTTATKTETTKTEATKTETKNSGTANTEPPKTETKTGTSTGQGAPRTLQTPDEIYQEALYRYNLDNDKKLSTDPAEVESNRKILTAGKYLNENGCLNPPMSSPTLNEAIRRYNVEHPDGPMDLTKQSSREALEKLQAGNYLTSDGKLGNWDDMHNTSKTGAKELILTDEPDSVSDSGSDSGSESSSDAGL